ncbi:MAG: YodC family protein [Acidithiobacillus sp.]
MNSGGPLMTVEDHEWEDIGAVSHLLTRCTWITSDGRHQSATFANAMIYMATTIKAGHKG